MPVPCSHPRTGVVTTDDGRWGQHAEAPVCGSPECVAEATEWVQRMTGKAARHVLDAEVVS